MVETTDLGERSDPLDRWFLNQPGLRAVHLQRKMRPPALVVLEVGLDHPPQVPLVQDDDVIETFLPDATNQALDVRVLPPRSRPSEVNRPGIAGGSIC